MGAVTDTFKLMAQHIPLVGERAGPHCVCTMPVSPRGQSREPTAVLTGRSVKAIPLRRKGTVIRPVVDSHALWGPRGACHNGWEGLVTTSSLWWRASTSQGLVDFALARSEV